MPLITKNLTISEDTPAELCKADRAVQSLTDVSRSQIRALFENQCVRLNDEICSAPYQRLAVGDRIEVRYYSGQRYPAKPKPPGQFGVKILFEDPHLIVVNKPPNVLTVPAPGHDKGTLIQKVAAYLGRKPYRGPVVFAVQRLDREASGVLVFAKTQDAYHALRQQFAAHLPEREYLILAAGVMDRKKGTLRSRLTTNRRLKRYSADEGDYGEMAVTHYEVEQQLRDAALVRVRLETGRRNQIRVQFAEAGHPVLGDSRYEPEVAAHTDWPSNRLALHAAVLAFEHPATGEPQRFVVPEPREFREFISSNRPRFGS
jgi:23S rRNA pseudouridine1911/1915/1917 synthase